jgi:hypothetical protein
VLASLLDGHFAPEAVDVRWRQPALGSRGGGPMLRSG